MGKLGYENNKFYFSAAHSAPRGADKDAEQAGLLWDKDSLRWVTRSPQKALKLRRFADESAERKLKSTFITDLQPPEHISYPDQLAPKSWQMESAWHCLTRTPAYCADEAGLGKTIVACLCMNSAPGRVLVICPAHLKYNWFDELDKWTSNAFTNRIVADGSDLEALRAYRVILPDSLLTNSRIQQAIEAQSFEWILIDEAHRFKSDTAKRTDALLGVQNHAVRSSLIQLGKRVVFLSGTPIPNGKPIELYSVLSRCAPESIQWRSLQSYGKAFCGARYSTRFEGTKAIAQVDYNGTSNLKQLRRELRQKFMIRHLKKNHLKELGPKTRQLIFLDTPKHIQQLEAKLLKNYTLEELMGDNTKLGDIATYRAELGTSKITPAFSFLHQLLENSDEKLVVFAHHVDVVEGIARMLDGFNALMIRGGMTSKAKNDAVKKFQTDPKHRVIVGNITAMGTGHTLTKSPRVVFAEYSWVPGENEQAEDRIHRMTQNDNVFCQYLVVRGTLDERMLRAVLSKQQAIDQVMA